MYFNEAQDTDTTTTTTTCTTIYWNEADNGRIWGGIGQAMLRSGAEEFGGAAERKG